MKRNKKLIALIVAIMIVMGLSSSCTAAPEGKALYDAMIKSQSIKSCQSDMEFVLRLDAAGLSEKDQQSYAQLKAMLDGAKFSMKAKQITNADNTTAKTQADVNMSFAGTSMDMGVWVDMDLNGDPPKLKEIIKPPAMMTAADPSLAGKAYMVMDFNELTAASGQKNQTQGVDYVNTMKLTKELQAKAAVFLSKYLLQYDPGFQFITDGGIKDITTSEGIVKAHIYQIKLDDKAAKKLLRYTVNNFLNNKDAMDFALEYMKLVKAFSAATASSTSPSAELEKFIADYEKEKPVILEKFNKSMDELENIQMVGDKGITLEYGIDENGYIVIQSGSMDFVVDAAKLNKLESIKPLKTENAVRTEKAGVYHIGFDFNIVMHNINKEFVIEMPAVTPANSFSYRDMLKSKIPVEEAKQELRVSKKLSKVYNKASYVLARDTVKLIKGGSYIYTKGTATIKAGDKSLVLVLGKTTAKVNGKEVKLNTANGKLVGGRVYLSVEALEQLGLKITLE